MLYFCVFADISARSSRQNENFRFFIYFFFASAVLRQGLPFQFSSPNSLKWWRWSFRKLLSVFWLAQLVRSLKKLSIDASTNTRLSLRHFIFFFLFFHPMYWSILRHASPAPSLSKLGSVPGYILLLPGVYIIDVRVNIST